MIWLFILFAILLPQLGLPGQAPRIAAWALLIASLVLFIVWPEFDVRVRTDP